jgi:ATP-binding cassette subfamily B protein RaxB
MKSLFAQPRFPYVRSVEAADCGLACLCMVAGHHGQAWSLHEVKARFASSLKGLNLRGLVTVAGALGLTTRALRLELSDLKHLATPCILHWDLNHFVVLIEVGSGTALIADPASGVQRISAAEVSERFTGVALELWPNEQFFNSKPAAPQPLLRRFLFGFPGLKRSLVLLFVASASLQVLLLVSPLFIQWVVDRALSSTDVQALVVVAAAFLALVFFQAAFSVVRGLSTAFVSNQLSRAWLAGVFAHLCSLPISWFEKRYVGDVSSRMNSTIAIQRALTTNVVEGVLDGLMALLIAVVLCLYSPLLLAISASSVLTYVAIRALTFRVYLASMEAQVLAGARQNSHLLESLRGMLSLRVSDALSAREAEYANFVVDTTNQDARVAKFQVGFAGANILVFGAEKVVVVALGAYLAIDGALTVGMLVAFLAYRDQFAARMQAFVDHAYQIKTLRLHADRLADILASEPDTRPSISLDAPEHFDIEVDGLGFRYSPTEPWVLRNVTFSVRQGESVAITGPSGSGKTTLAKILVGALRATEGSVRIGGVPIDQLSQHDLYRTVAAVMQDDQLFAGSVAENVSLGGDSTDASGIESAARAANIHSEIEGMTMGYQSLIGDMGSSLSGGQKQRLVLARALFRQTKILVLDEATSHLDVSLEHSVNAEIARLPLTRIIIAHRPETIASADRVIHMVQGRVMA